MHIRQPTEENQHYFFLKTNLIKEWEKEGKAAKNELENDDYGFLQPLYSVYKKSGQFVFQTYLLTCLKKDTSVLLKAVKIWVSEEVKYKSNRALTLKKKLCICAESL